jgi:DeoR family fructose operon transcriptional repressor
MNFNERAKTILELLDENEELTVDELVEKLNISPSTARRDVTKMEEGFMVKRYHGGIKKIDVVHQELQTPINYRINVLENSKEIIGKKASELIKHNFMIFVDGGSTSLSLIEHIDDMSITVVTNGIKQAQLCKVKNIKCFLLGGSLEYQNNALLGYETVQQVKKFRFDMAFFSCTGIDNQVGLMAPNQLQIDLKSTLLDISKEFYLLVDHTKFKRRSLSNLNGKGKDKIKIITDKVINEFNYYQVLIADR